MNKKGFVSTTIVYSFFLVFLLILLYIVSDLVNNRILINAMKDEIKNEISEDNLGRYLIINMDEINNNGINIVKHDSSFTYSSLDNSYRFVGSNPNNYICFGSTASTCPADNLYRIIGIFNNQVKIIKNIAYGTQAFDNLNSNYYVSSNMHAYLNGTFLNTLGTTWNEKIADHTWYVGGISNQYTNRNVYNIYDVEVGDSKVSSVYVNAKIGLMYISDFGYATTTNYYGRTLNTATTNNWLFTSGQNTWFITRNSSSNNSQYYLTSSGTINVASVSSSYQVRPCFYLNSNVKISSGTGTSSNPYRIEV